jgi:hypothetical protein
VQKLEAWEGIRRVYFEEETLNWGSGTSDLYESLGKSLSMFWTSVPI